MQGAARDAWQVMAAREAVARIPSSSGMRLLLARLLELADSEAEPKAAAVGPRLMAYGRALETLGEWGLAADVYTSATDVVPADLDLELLADAQARLAYVERMRARWDEADLAIQRASALAGRLGDARRVLRLKVSSANVQLNRGRLDRAEDILGETLALSAIMGGEVHSEVLHARGELDYDRRNPRGALEWFERALGSSPSEIGRERLLLNISAAALDLGARTVARDALLVLAVTAQTSNTRWLAVVNLIEVATLDRNELVFEQYRRELAAESLPPRTAAYFAIYEGHGYRAFGRTEAARLSYERAASLAVEHQLDRVARDAAGALSALESHVSELRPKAETALPASLLALAARVRALREEAVGAA
ncbi:MAG: hypothetical protein HYX65_07915 [Gemmatimonadetes bacterium]|nr:hypothetical protein [Gemmatimonadota bacterium]